MDSEQFWEGAILRWMKSAKVTGSPSMQMIFRIIVRGRELNLTNRQIFFLLDRTQAEEESLWICKSSPSSSSRQESQS